MKSSGRLPIIKKFLRKNEEGFSLIELVVVVAVLSALSAIAIPQFNCIQRKAKASTALAAMRQIQKECAVNTASTGRSSTFSSSNLHSYQILSDGSNSCSGAQSTGVISATPNNTSQLPTFIFDTGNNLLKYRFKGATGLNLATCLKAVCGSSDQSLEGLIMLNSDIVYNDSYVTRGCSGYALVKGATWTEANANAQKLGGFLATPNNEDENQFLINQFTDKLSVTDPSWNNGIRAGAWIGLTSNSDGDFIWANGNELDAGYESPFGAGQNEYSAEYQERGVASGFHLLMRDPSGHAQQHGGINGWWQEPVNGQEYYGEDNAPHWLYNWDIAEVPICN